MSHRWSSHSSLTLPSDHCSPKKGVSGLFGLGTAMWVEAHGVAFEVDVQSKSIDY
jgi:hypothetical protein